MMVSKISVRASMERMGPGETLEVPIDLRKPNAVRNCASLLGSELGRQYSVSVDREAGISKVTRIL